MTFIWKNALYRVCILMCIFAIPACEMGGRVDQGDGLRDIIPTAEKDRAPVNPKITTQVPNAIPRFEYRTTAGNKSPYKVKGVVYHVLTSGEGYAETGVASWYGEKFHGNRTSNSEIYDMYKMTAAHKTLPIPSYAKVTHLENKKSIIVRINDRGPFERGRIIDLSYAGALTLGYLDKGTARVRVEYIPVSKYRHAQSTKMHLNTEGELPSSPASVLSSLPVSGFEDVPQRYLQIGAFSELASASKLKRKISAMSMLPVGIESSKSDIGEEIHKVHIGPIHNDTAFEQIKQQLSVEGLAEPLAVFK